MARRGIIHEILKEIIPNLNKETFIDEIKLALWERDLNAYNRWGEDGFCIRHVFHGQETLLHLAAATGNMELVKVLVQNDAIVNEMSHFKGTPLHLAAECGHADIVEFLISNNAFTNVMNKDGDTPLHLAAEGGHADIVEILKRNRAYNNIKNKDGDTPLHLAAQNNHLEVVKRLVEITNINSKNFKFKDPIDCALEKGYHDIVQYLSQLQLDRENGS